MSTNICNFCNSEFKSNYILKAHQKTAKYCLKIQGVNDKLLKCKYCSYTSTTRTHMKNHHNTCKVKKEMEENELKDKLAQANIEKEKQVRLAEITKIESDIRQKIMEDRLKDELKEKNVFITEALKPKVTNNSNNLTLNATMEYMQQKLHPFHEIIPKLGSIIDSKFTETHLLAGPEGCATFISDEILTDTNGNSYYATTDKNSTGFYKDNKDTIQMDDNGQMVKQHIIPKVIDKSSKVYQEKKKYMNSIGEHDNFSTLKPYSAALNKIKRLKNNCDPVLRRLAKNCKISSERIKIDIDKEDSGEKLSRPYNDNVVSEMINELKTCNDKEITKILGNVGDYCSFILLYIDYYYDVYEEQFYYYILENDTLTKVTEKSPGKLYELFEFNMKNILRGPNLYKLKMTSQICNIERDEKLIQIVKDIIQEKYSE